MNRPAKVILASLLMASASVPSSMATPRYLTQKLARMGDAMGIGEAVAEMSDTVLSADYKGFPVVVEVGRDSVVSHIGYDIFSPEMKSTPDGPVMRFVERYSLEADLPIEREKTVNRQLAEDEVTFEKGRFSDIRRLSKREPLSFSINNLDGSRYSISWADTLGNPVVQMGFPISHKMILGAKQEELYERIFNGLQRYETEPVDSAVFAPRDFDTDDDYYMDLGKFYVTEELNTDRYYLRMPEQQFELINSDRYPIETLTNMLLTNHFPNDNTAAVRFVDIADRPTVEMPLRQFVDYMFAEGCEPYFGLIRVEGTEVTFMLLFKNDVLGYAHSMRGVADLDDFPSKLTTVRLRMLTYIPISTIQNLFSD